VHTLFGYQVSLQRVCVFIVDEADRMLDMGFEPQLMQVSEPV
jgi:superfamily II DNA/RNA helicase